MKRLYMMAVVFSAALSGYAEKMPFSYYQSIIDRQMFGPLPPDFDPTKMPSEVSKSSSADEKVLTKEQEKLQSSIHFSMINVTTDGSVEVGFTDKSDPKAPRHYCLRVGESRDGWTVLDADPKAATMTISKGDIEVSLKIGGDSSKDGGATAKAGGETGGGVNALKRPGLLSTSSLRGRRMQRLAAQRQQEEQEAKRRAEDQERRQQEAEDRRQELESLRESIRSLREVKMQKAEEAQSEKTEHQSGDENNQPE